MRTSMQECREVGAVVLAGMEVERVALEHHCEPIAGVANLVPDCGKLCEMAGDLPFVPGE
jgi:hypothetical protein